MSSGTKKKRTMTKSAGARKKQKQKDDEQNVEDEMRMYGMAVQGFVDKLTRQVYEDWHDGYEEQAETTGEWFMTLRLPLQKILDIGIADKSCLKQCNELLKVLSTSWKDLNEVGSRVKMTTMLGETCDRLSFELRAPWSENPMDISAFCFGSHPEDIFAYIWNALLRTHASLEGTDEGLLLQCIKDASDNKGDDITFDGPLCHPYADPADDYGDESNAPDRKALACIIKEKESVWKVLPKTYTR